MASIVLTYEGTFDRGDGRSVSARMFGRRSLPPPLDLDWPMKAWEDAELELRYERAHMIMTIEHELVRGVTPAMLGLHAREAS